MSLGPLLYLRVGGGGGLGRDSGFLCLGLWMVSELEGFGMGLGATDASRVGRFFG